MERVTQEGDYQNGKPPQRPEPRYIRAILSAHTLEELLSLPADVEIAGIYLTPEWRGYTIHLRGDRFPVNESGQELPIVGTDLEYVALGDSGRIIVARAKPDLSAYPPK